MYESQDTVHTSHTYSLGLSLGSPSRRPWDKITNVSSLLGKCKEQ